MSHLGQHVIGIYFGRGMRPYFDLKRKKIGGDLALRFSTDLVRIIYALYRVYPNLMGGHLKFPAFFRYAKCLFLLVIFVCNATQLFFQHSFPQKLWDEIFGLA